MTRRSTSKLSGNAGAGRSAGPSAGRPAGPAAGLRPAAAGRVVIAGRFRGRGGVGPLTLGQRNTLAWVDQELDRFSAVVSWRFALPAGVTVAAVHAALTELVARHEALRTSFPAGDQQLVAAEGDLVVELVELDADPRSDDTIADELIGRLRSAGVDFTSGLPLRLALGLRGGRPAVLVAAYSHMAIDFGSAALLGREFDQLLAGASLPPPEHQPLDQAGVENSPHGRRQAASALRYWQERLDTAPQAMCTLPPPDGGAGHRTGFLRSPSAGRALAAIAARTGASRQAIVVAALSVLLCHRTGVRHSTFVAVSGNRFRLRLRNYVGSLAQDGLLALDVGASGFDELVGRSVKASLAAYTHSIFDAPALWSLIDSVGDKRGVAFSRDFAINDVSSHLGSPPEDVSNPVPEPAVDEPTSLEWMDAPDFPTVLMCNPVQLAPEFQLALTYDAARLDRAEVERLLLATEALLTAAAAGDVPLSELTAITGLEPVRRDEDWVFVDGCWVRLSACRRLLSQAAGSPVTVEVRDGELTAAVPDDPLVVRARALELIRQADHRLALIPTLRPLVP